MLTERSFLERCYNQIEVYTPGVFYLLPHSAFNLNMN